MAQMFSGFMGANLFGGQINLPSEEKEKVRRKFINHVSKYKDREMDFFVDECERFNYVATNLMKKIMRVDFIPLIIKIMNGILTVLRYMIIKFSHTLLMYIKLHLY